MYRVFDHTLDLGYFEGREGLVTGLEIKDLSVTSLVETARAEDLAAAEARYKQELIGGGNYKGLTVGLLVLEGEKSVDISRYGVRRLGDPKDLTVARLPPGQVAGRAEEVSEGL